MKFLIMCVILVSCCYSIGNSQVQAEKQEQSLQFMSKDSSSFIKLGIRFQNLFSSQWSYQQNANPQFSNYESEFLVRRARVKFSGWIKSPQLKYNMQLGLSNLDMSANDTDAAEFGFGSNIIMDAQLIWEFNETMSIRFGQAKLPDHREYMFSSAHLQFVDRSLLNSFFSLDRHVGIQLHNESTLGQSFVLREAVAFSQGEGRNVTSGFHGGYDFTAQVECLPLGPFASDGELRAADLAFESSPKISLSASHDFNQNAVRAIGQRGSFITDFDENYTGRPINTFFADLFFKHKGISNMIEYANKQTSTGESVVYIEQNQIVNYFIHGYAWNIQTGYMVKPTVEFDFRYTFLETQTGIVRKTNEYGIACSKFKFKHNLKLQADLSYQQKEFFSDDLRLRAQLEFHI